MLDASSTKYARMLPAGIFNGSTSPVFQEVGDPVAFWDDTDILGLFVGKSVIEYVEDTGGNPVYVLSQMSMLISPSASPSNVQLCISQS